MPPYRTAAGDFPLGRIIYGGDPDPRMVRMARAQGMQAPIRVDVGWAAVGHVDEMVTFLPARNARGWVLGVADPRAGRALLERAAAEGGRDTPVLKGMKVSMLGHDVDAQRTVGQMLDDADITTGTERAAGVIDGQLGVLKRELGLGDDEIVRLPILARSAGDGTTVAALPNVVNSQHLAGGRLLIPLPHGPVVGGRDLMQDDIAQRLARVGVTPVWIDDYQHAHVGGGEVHCSTNVLRRLPPRVTGWWRHPAGG